MKKKLVIFHPAIAPYRIDFFNSLNEHFEASFYFEFRNALEQSFDQEKLRERQTFQSRYLKPGLMGIKNLRLEAWSILRREKPDLVEGIIAEKPGEIKSRISCRGIPGTRDPRRL